MSRAAGELRSSATIAIATTTTERCDTNHHDDEHGGPTALHGPPACPVVALHLVRRSHLHGWLRGAVACPWGMRCWACCCAAPNRDVAVAASRRTDREQRKGSTAAFPCAAPARVSRPSRSGPMVRDRIFAHACDRRRAHTATDGGSAKSPTLFAGCSGSWRAPLRGRPSAPRESDLRGRALLADRARIFREDRERMKTVVAGERQNHP